MILLEVVAANYEGEYRVRLTFNNGYRAVVDLKDTLERERRAIFQPLRDLNYFRNFSIKLNTICWENEADFAPEYLYELGQHQALPVTTLKQAA